MSVEPPDLNAPSQDANEGFHRIELSIQSAQKIIELYGYVKHVCGDGDMHCDEIKEICPESADMEFEVNDHPCSIEEYFEYQNNMMKESYDLDIPESEIQFFEKYILDIDLSQICLEEAKAIDVMMKMYCTAVKGLMVYKAQYDLLVSMLKSKDQ